MVTNNSGDVVYSNAFNPYGGIQQAWIDDFNPIQEYSGKERDEESGMDYFGARYYEHSSYRWTSPDPIIASYDYDPKH
jgi:RHS repeat-associated protein